MANPAKHAARAYPETGSDNQPEYASQYSAVVNLPYAWNQKTQDCCDTCVSHIASITSIAIYEK
jgi:hypothetical protein